MAKKSGYEFWTCALKRARYVVAPMVDQSELAWRMLSRKYGAQLCYTPMLHASVFRRDANYRRDNLITCPEDRPLIVQFCGNDPQTILEAARYAEPYCDAIDLNLGCPQSVARKGHYGAFLQDEWDLLRRIVSLLHAELSVPVTCKIRVFEDVEKTTQYARMLEAAGCQLLTVHGRTREQKGPNTGLASWEHIRAVKQSVSIPVFANGNIQFLRDVERCRQETYVDGIMAAEGSLYNPAIFTGEQPPCWRVAMEYLEYEKRYPCPLSYIRGHLFKIWFHVLKQPEYQCYREKLGAAKSLETVEQICHELKSLLQARLTPEDLSAEFSLDDVPFWRCQPYISSTQQTLKRSHCLSDGSDPAVVDACVVKRLKNRQVKREPAVPRGSRWSICSVCKANPKGTRCNYNLCKICCKMKCKSEKLDCIGHKFYCREREKPAATELSPPELPVPTASDIDSISTSVCTADLT